ncbi:polyprenyl synthetase family protein [Neomegalonema perideroedes]|uniref:polyprenyl synthetase family protein n=1 Tax=Neomegalonema perideroedes TaxID=217219 RepID=UPI0003615D98|nr:farnesyl diphosphate synthase [Neomegalonema perideroedes]
MSPAALSPEALEARLAEAAAAVEETLDALLPQGEGPESRLWEAMRYGALGGGKRLRAFLVLESAALFGVCGTRSRRVAAAAECLHAYSLIHDDLPAMDDDDLRRGRPTTHRAFDEATAILAGDALQSRAFEILAEEATHENPFTRCELVRSLAAAAGARGMAGGQMIDMQAEARAASGEPLRDLGAVAHLQRLKTGALIGFSCAAGAILGGADATRRQALEAYAQDFGLAFQIRDDLLDHEGDEAEAGKRLHKDEEAGKATFVDLLGLEGARERASMLAAQAAARLECFGPAAEALKAAARFAALRRR